MSEDELLNKYISENFDKWLLNEPDINVDEFRKQIKNTLSFAMYNVNFRLNECVKIISDYLKTILN